MESITVIMPARNAFRTIKFAAASILKAMPRDGRLLVFDDASSDGTLSYLRDLARADKRVGVLSSDVNIGVAGALNRLIEEAETPLIVRMDADDISLPWRFQHQLPVIEDGRMDVLFSSMIMFGNFRGCVQPQVPIRASPAASRLELLLINTLPHSTLAGRRASFVGCGGYRHVPAEDWDLWLRMSIEGYRLGRLAIPDLLYRRHVRQTSSRSNWYSADTHVAHSELAIQTLGLDLGDAFVALCSETAERREVQSAMSAIEAVRAAAQTMRTKQDRLSVTRAASLATRRLRKVYKL